jgi:hypothetical protein
MGRPDDLYWQPLHLHRPRLQRKGRGGNKCQLRLHGSRHIEAANRRLNGTARGGIPGSFARDGIDAVRALDGSNTSDVLPPTSLGDSLGHLPLPKAFAAM